MIFAHFLSDLKAPNSLRASAEKLVQFLIKPCKNDVEKARALIRWVSENIQYDTDYLKTGIETAKTASAVLLTGKAICDGYSSAVNELGR